MVINHDYQLLSGMIHAWIGGSSIARERAFTTYRSPRELHMHSNGEVIPSGNSDITMGNHNFEWAKPLKVARASIAILVYQG